MTVQGIETYTVIMAGHDAAISSELDKIHLSNQAVLDQVQALITPEAFQQIKDTLTDSGYTHSYLITDRPLGESQDDDYVRGDVCVDQTTNGGYTGDDYAGTISMQ